MISSFWWPLTIQRVTCWTKNWAIGFSGPIRGMWAARAPLRSSTSSDRIAIRWAPSNCAGLQSGATLESSRDDVLLDLARAGDLLEQPALLLGRVRPQDAQRVDAVEQLLVLLRCRLRSDLGIDAIARRRSSWLRIGDPIANATRSWVRRQPPLASATLVLPALIHGIIARSRDADELDRVVLALLLEALVVGPAGLALGDPLVGEAAVLDLVEDAAHLGARLVGDDARAAGEVAVLGRVGDRVAHAGDPLLVHQVDDQLDLVEALEVRHLRRVAGGGQRLEAGLHERRQPAAQHDLLAEQVGLGLLRERRLDDAGAGAADGVGVRQGELLGLAGGVLLDGDQRRHAATLGVGAAHEVAGALGGDHDHVDALGRGDAAVADVEAVGEGEGVARRQVGGDVLVVDRLLLGVGGEEHDDVGGGRGLGDRQHLEALRLGLGDRRRALAQADDRRRRRSP